MLSYPQKSLKQKHNIRHPVNIKQDSFAEVNSTTVLIWVQKLLHKFCLHPAFLKVNTNLYFPDGVFSISRKPLKYLKHNIYSLWTKEAPEHPKSLFCQESSMMKDTEWITAFSIETNSHSACIPLEAYYCTT